jgi:hypothetical protein
MRFREGLVPDERRIANNRIERVSTRSLPPLEEVTNVDCARRALTCEPSQSFYRSRSLTLKNLDADYIRGDCCGAGAHSFEATAGSLEESPIATTRFEKVIGSPANRPRAQPLRNIS